ncbi:MAG TPA: hypothetical protein VF865_07760 [Acidobacteriaceae bacterium]
MPYSWSEPSVSSVIERRNDTVRRAFPALLVFLVLCACNAFSQPPALDDLVQGKELVAHLSLGTAPDSSADETLFRQLGPARSAQLLMAVVANGQTPAATSQDWAGMHRAYDALIELDTGQQQFLQASIFASMQNSAYRNDEGDYLAALAAAHQALDLQQRSGPTATLFLPWKNIGEDLICLGRIDEAAAAFYQARQLIQDPTSLLAGDLWSEIVSLESSRGNSSAALNESAAFLRAAGPSTPAVFRAGALLAAANLEIDQDRYDDAIPRIHAALVAIKGVPNATLIAYQAVDSLLALGLRAMQSIPYDQAIALCDRLDKDFPSLPVSISGFAREVGNHRRRLAGQFDLVLRDDSARLERARAGNDLSGQLAALLSTAVDYAYLRESTQQIAALHQATDILHTSSADGVSPMLRYRIQAIDAEDRGRP